MQWLYLALLSVPLTFGSGPTRAIRLLMKLQLSMPDGMRRLIATSQDTRVDDNDVETTNLGYRLGDGVADRCWICAVCLDREAGFAFPLDRSDRVARFVRRRHVGQTDVGALSRKAGGSGGADATRPAEHDRDFAGQFTIFTHSRLHY
jgi:hypothetical protein